MKCHTLGKMLQNLSSAAIVIGALREMQQTTNAIFQDFQDKN